MIGRFLFGAVTGGVFVLGGLMVASVLFPTDPPATPALVPDAQPGATAPADPAPAPEPQAEAVTPPTTEAPAPETPDPTPAPQPEPEPAATDSPEESSADPAAKATTDVAAAPVTTETAGAAAVAPDPTGQSAAADATPAAEPEPQAEAMAAAEPPPEGLGSEEPATEAEAPQDAAPAGVANDAIAPDAPTLADTVVETETDALAEVAQPMLPDQPLGLPQLDTDAVLAALDKSVATPALPAAGESGTEAAPVAPQPDTPPSEPEVASDDPPVSDAPAEAEPGVAEAIPAPETEAGDIAGLPGEPVPELPGLPPEALPEAEADLPFPEVAELPEAADEDPSSSTFKPAPGLGNKDGVVVRRLPRIGDTPGEAMDPQADTAEGDSGTDPEDPRPIARFAAPFDNPENKPVMAVVLIDSGRDDLDRAALADLPLPVTIALDPLDPATPDRAATYRAAGKEVAMLATGIFEGAQASDVEVAFQSMDQGLPEAVAVMDLVQPLFQQRRPLASLVVPVVGAQGRGLLTWDQGLNAADQVARREDIPAAVVFRDLGSAGTDRASIRRILDRAVFKAGQDGRVTVAGEASAETVAALLEWTVEGRGATVAMGPLTAVLMTD